MAFRQASFGRALVQQQFSAINFLPILMHGMLLVSMISPSTDREILATNLQHLSSPAKQEFQATTMVRLLLKENTNSYKHEPCLQIFVPRGKHFRAY